VATPRPGFVDLGAIRLHYLDFEGPGPPVLCVHGVGSHAWSFRGLARELGFDARVVAVDLRGHGDSQWSEGAAYSTTDLASDVIAMLDHLEIARITVVGVSWGGLVGLAVATRRPDLVARLAMIDISPASSQPASNVPPRPASFPSHCDALEWERAKSAGAAPEDVEAMAYFGYRPGEGGALVRKSDPYFLARWPFRDEDWWPVLPLVVQPTLVIRAGHGLLSEDEAARMVGALAAGRVVTIADSGHAIQLENPRALATELRAFFPSVIAVNET
jgi:pimeloyl-ACP methyl ester carboxylesterase